MKLDTNALNEEAELYCFFVPIKAISIKKINVVKEFLEKYGVDFDLPDKSFNKARFYYFFINGYCKNLDLYFCVGEMFVANETGVIKIFPILFFAKESLFVDEFMMEFFGVFNEDRCSIPILQSIGAFGDLIHICSTYFNELQPLYLKEITKELSDLKVNNE